jgi:Domain of unknown function (DUF4388)
MSAGRRGPLSFLDTEWRTALWRRWVSAHLVPDSTNSANSDAPLAPAVPAAAPEPVIASTSASQRSPSASSAVPPSPERAEATPRRAPISHDISHDEARRSERRGDVRARFDALSERLQGLEDAIDVIARRISHRTRRERRTERRTAELVESIAETVEAQAAAIDSLASALERIERRLDRSERSGNREDGERRDSRAPKARNSEPPRSAHPPRADEASDFSFGREPAEDTEAAISGSSIRGSIGDMSLSTVLAMIEIERRSGRLKVQGEDGSIVAFELEEGSVVGSRVSENDVDAVESLREVLTWKGGRFWFRQNPSESLVSPPRSVNSLLLEATRQIDEAVRAG